MLPKVRDDSGTTTYGLRAGFFVGNPPPGLVATTPLSVDRGRVDAGDRLVALALQVGARAVVPRRHGLAAAAAVDHRQLAPRPD